MRRSPADEAATDSADLADYLLASLNFVSHISEKAACKRLNKTMGPPPLLIEEEKISVLRAQKNNGQKLSITQYGRVQ